MLQRDRTDRGTRSTPGAEPDHRAAARAMAAECLCFRARRVARALTRLYDEALRPLGLEANQLTLLNAIALVEEAGAPSSRLAEVLSVDSTTLSRNLRPLERQGLIRITRLARDRRVRRVRLTAEGRRRIAEALPLWARAQERVTAALSSDVAGEVSAGFDAAAAAAEAVERWSARVEPHAARTGTP